MPELHRSRQHSQLEEIVTRLPVERWLLLDGQLRHRARHEGLLKLEWTASCGLDSPQDTSFSRQLAHAGRPEPSADPAQPIGKGRPQNKRYSPQRTRATLCRL